MARRNKHRRLSRRSTLVLCAALAAPALLLGALPPGSPASAAPPSAPESIDENAMRVRLGQEEITHQHQRRRPPADARVREQEPAGVRGANDTTGDATRVSRTSIVDHDDRRRGRHDEPYDKRLRIEGALAGELPDPVRVEPNEEDDGAISLARELELGPERPRARVTGVIGDGPHGSEGDGSGDFDFYRFDAEAGETLTVDIAPEGGLIPQVLLYDAEGNLLIGARDRTTGPGGAHLSHPVARDRTYYLAVVGGRRPTDPFDSGSGSGVGTEGAYRLDVAVDRRDTDVYAVHLRPGEVFGATVEGAAGRLAVYRPNGELAQASGFDASTIYPASSPLPGGGNATVDHVAERDGLHFLAVSDGSGSYSVTASTVSARRENSTGNDRHDGYETQVIYLDFSGPRFDNRIFDEAAVEPGVRDLSPMRQFLPSWGIDETDERAVVQATTRQVEQILRDDIPGSRVRVLNSLDHPDAWGKPGVSRVIVGGTYEEAGVVPAIGISEFVDPGNFDREDTAIVMLGQLSAPAGTNPFSLNTYLTEDSDRVRAVGQAVGNIAGHEIGHLLGNWHTDSADGRANLMDSSNLLGDYTLGPDGVAGTEDDVRPAMSISRFHPLQGFAGVQDSRARTRVALR